MPRRAATASTARPPRWDLPARMAVATVLVLALTAAAPILGPFTSGVVSGFPLYASVLAVFAQRDSGPAAAVEVMRGLGVGLFAFAAFFFGLASLLRRIDTVAVFVCATAAAFLVQALSYVLSTARNSSNSRVG
jgi:hypothetical protein